MDEGAFEVVVSPLLLAESRRVLAYAKVRSRVGEAEAEAFLALVGEGATVVEDPARDPSFRTENPHDDVVVALAQTSRSVIVSGDQHLLGITARLPVRSPAEFLRTLARMASDVASATASNAAKTWKAGS